MNHTWSFEVVIVCVHAQAVFSVFLQETVIAAAAMTAAVRINLFIVLNAEIQKSRKDTKSHVNSNNMNCSNCCDFAYICRQYEKQCGAYHGRPAVGRPAPPEDLLCCGVCVLRHLSVGGGRQYLQCGPADHLAGARGIVGGLDMGGQCLSAGYHDDPAVVLLARGAVQLQAGVCLRRGALHRRLAVLRPVPYPAAADCLEGFSGYRSRDDDEREHYPREDYLSEEVSRQRGGNQRYGRGPGRRDRSYPGRGHPLVRLRPGSSR